MPKSNITSEISQMNYQDIAARIAEDRKRYAKMKHMHAVTPLESPVKLRYLRRDIARMQQLLDNRKKTENSQKNKANNTEG